MSAHIPARERPYLRSRASISSLNRPVAVAFYINTILGVSSVYQELA